MTGEVLVIVSEVGNLGVATADDQVEGVLAAYFDAEEADARKARETDPSCSTFHEPRFVIRSDGSWEITALCEQKDEGEERTAWQRGHIERWALPQ